MATSLLLVHPLALLTQANMAPPTISHQGKPSIPTTASGAVDETVTSRKFASYNTNFVFVRLNNGGNYPAKSSAEFSRTYVNSLRAYPEADSPEKIAKPRATSAARKLSKVGADNEYDRVGPFYKS